MQRSLKIAVGAGAVVLAAAGIGTSVAAASGGDDDASHPITGSDLKRASAAALAETGGGRVTETEAGDEESAYEVEVTLADGRQVDVQLDAAFEVVQVMGDHEDS
jgi:uncharacterized membrane protein YkoI